MKGQQYIGTQKQPGNTQTTITKAPRVMGEGCGAIHRKLKNAKYSKRCHEINEEMRQELFDAFWKMDWGEKKVYISSIVEIKAKASQGESRRSQTYNYNLNIQGHLYPVCKEMFLSTLGIGARCQHTPSAGRSDPRFLRLCDGNQPRPILPRSSLHASSGLRG